MSGQFRVVPYAALLPSTLSSHPKAQHSAHFIPEHRRDMPRDRVLCLGLSCAKPGKTELVRLLSLCINQRWGMPCDVVGNTT